MIIKDQNKESSLKMVLLNGSLKCSSVNLKTWSQRKKLKGLLSCLV